MKCLFQFSSIWYFSIDTSKLCARVWRILVGRTIQRTKKNQIVYDFPWLSFTSRKLGERIKSLHLDAYAIERRENAIRTQFISTHQRSNVDKIQRNFFLLYIDSRASNYQCSIFNRHACSVAEFTPTVQHLHCSTSVSRVKRQTKNKHSNNFLI